MKSRCAVFLLAVGLVAATREASLIGSKVFSVDVTSEDDIHALEDLENRVDGIDFLQKARVLGDASRILVYKDSIAIFKSLMESASIAFKIIIDDVKGTLDEESRQHDIARKSHKSETISFAYYNRHSEINAYLKGLAKRFPSTVTLNTTARSGEGRELLSVLISTSGGRDSRKPVIIMDAGIHAREWIAPANALYTITKLVEDITESDIVDAIDWVITPLLNPDGYEFSQTNERLWRKTRSTEFSKDCPGVDANRNFGYKWMVSGSSSDPCSDSFAGSRPFSEPESRHLRDLILRYKGRAKGYLAIHSAGSYVLYPYAYDSSLPLNGVQLKSLGGDIGRAIDAASPPGYDKYLAGNSSITMKYNSSGCSIDYAYAKGDILLNYCLELPSGKDGESIFIFPPSKIFEVVKATWAGVVVFARAVIKQAIAEGMYV